MKRNVDHLLRSGCLVDLVHLAPSPGTESWRPEPHPRLTRIQIPVRHRRSPAAWYVVEYATFFAFALVAATYLAARRRYDAVHVDNLPDSLVFAASLARLRGARLVLNIVDPMPDLTAARLGLGRGHLLVRAARLIERLSTAWADVVLVPNEDPCRPLVIGRGTPAGKVHVLANTLPAAVREPPPRAERPSVVCLGTLMPRYGVQVAIDAMALLRERRPELSLHIVGTGEYEPELRRRVADLGLEARVRFLGYQPWPTAMEEVRRSAVGVVPLLADGYCELMTPTKLFDYVQQGVPAVCSRLPGIEGFFPPDSVRYVEPGSAAALARGIEEVLADPLAATAMALRAQRALERYSWDRGGRRYLELLGISTPELPAAVRGRAGEPSA